MGLLLGNRICCVEIRFLGVGLQRSRRVSQCTADKDSIELAAQIRCYTAPDRIISGLLLYSFSYCWIVCLWILISYSFISNRGYKDQGWVFIQFCSLIILCTALYQRKWTNYFVIHHKGQVLNNLKANALVHFFRALLAPMDHLDHQ